MERDQLCRTVKYCRDHRREMLNMASTFNPAGKTNQDKLANLVNTEKPFKLRLALAPRPQDEEKEKKPRTKYKMGESVKIEFEVEKDCYLTLIDIGTSGKAHVIMPNSLQVDNFVRGGKVLLYPEGGWDVAAIIQGPAGTERIKAFATLDPINLFDINLRDMSNLFHTVSEDSLSDKISKLKKKLDSLDGARWTDALIEFKIV
jgi:hypothetical protein